MFQKCQSTLALSQMYFYDLPNSSSETSNNSSSSKICQKHFMVLARDSARLVLYWSYIKLSCAFCTSETVEKECHKRVYPSPTQEQNIIDSVCLYVLSCFEKLHTEHKGE